MSWPTTARPIESRNHPLLKRIRAIIRSGELLDEGQALLETPRLIEDAAASGMAITSLILREPLSEAARQMLTMLAALPRISAKTSGDRTPAQITDRISVPAATFATLTSTESSPGALALVEAPVWRADDLFPAAPAPLLIIAGVQDPGNLGAMLRAAEAFGLSGAILLRGTVSPWNAKAFRASAGTVLRLPVVRNFTAAQTVQLLEDHGVKLYGAVVRGGCAPDEIRPNEPLAVAVGAEAAGLPDELLRACAPLSIAMAERIDSLNVAAATAIILYEIAKPRGAQPRGRKPPAENRKGTSA